MNRYPLAAMPLRTSLALLLMSQIGLAQSGFYQPYGATRSGIAPSGGAGYSYVAPSYQLGLTQTTYRTYANYYGLPRTPAYRYSTRVPYFSHVQPYYQPSVYQPLGLGVPALGAPVLGAQPSVIILGQPSLGYALNPQAYTAYRPRVVYHPYTTVSQFVYEPTYSPFIGSNYPATCGAYGFSMFYGY